MCTIIETKIAEKMANIKKKKPSHDQHVTQQIFQCKINCKCNSCIIIKILKKYILDIFSHILLTTNFISVKISEFSRYATISNTFYYFY